MQTPKSEIVPTGIYTTPQVKNLLGINERTVLKLAVDLGGKKVGHSYLFVGDNILRYLGSVSYQQASSGNKSVDSQGAAKVA